jgi:hypothetical protein
METPYPSEPFAGPKKTNVLGIISTVIGALTGLAFCGLLVAMFATFGSIDMNATDYADSPEMMGLGISAIGLGLCVFASPVLTLVGLILGVVGLRQQDTENVMAIIGTVINGLIFLASSGCLLLGLVGALSPGLSQ